LKFQRKPQREVRLDLTALLDVVFLLLFFLIVSAKFVEQSQLTVNLPEAAGDSTEEEHQWLTVAVDKLGRYAINEGPFDIIGESDLIAVIAAEAARQEEPRLRIAADAKASHESVVRVMEAARQLGLTRVAISSEERPASLPEQTE